MKHTPTPWIMYDDDTSDELLITADLRYGQVAIAEVSIGFNKPFDDEQHANAAFIIEACNAYEAQSVAVKALREALAELVQTEEEYGDPSNVAVNESWLKAKAALAAHGGAEK